MTEAPGANLAPDDPSAMWDQKPPGYPALRYDPDWAEDLHEVLRRRLAAAGRIRLLDCCCGTGNPTLGLHLLHGVDYDIAWSDGAEEMLRRFRANAAHHGLELEPRRIAWDGLREHYGEERFDAVLCLGNSLIYADSWGGRPFDAERSRLAVHAALAQFHGVLRSGGVLFVDTTDAAELAGGKPMFGQGGWREEPDGEHAFSRDYIMTVDLDRSLRKVSNFRHRYQRAGHVYLGTLRCEFEGLALAHEALMDEMRAVGFGDVAPVDHRPFPWPLFVGTKQ